MDITDIAPMMRAQRALLKNRPLHAYLDPAFAAGLALDGLEEVGFALGSVEASRPFSWANYPEIPPVMAIRLRRAR